MSYSRVPKRNPSANKANPLLKQNTTDVGKKDLIDGLNSRKSTAVSTTSRIEASLPMGKKARQMLGSGGQTRDGIDFSDPKPFELSLNKKNKKPTKLKPLDRKASTGLEAYEYENAYKKEAFQEIENDLNDYLDPNTILA